MLDRMKWYGQSSFVLRDGRIVYLDPFRLRGQLAPADIVFITHAHGDHLSPDDLKKILKANTIILGPPDCLKDLKGNKIEVKPGDHRDVDGIHVDVVRAYNLNKPYHPKANNWVGFILQVGNERLYHAGDTDHIPEMADIKTDYAFLPVGGTYTMDAEEAARAADQINPKIAVPMHWGVVVGTLADAERFAKLTKVQTKIFDEEP